MVMRRGSRFQKIKIALIDIVADPKGIIDEKKYSGNDVSHQSLGSEADG